MRLLLLAAGALAADSGPVDVDMVHPADAPLRCVHFLSRSEGWVVGDQGAAFSTVDGGRTWQLRSRPTGSSLTFVRMREFEGFLAARRSLPYQRGGVGEILRTEDGGATWKPAATPPGMAGVRRIWFDDEGFGYAIGESSDAHPSGLAVTTDRGESWTLLGEYATAGWTAALALNDEHVILGDAEGRIWNLKAGQIRDASPDGVSRAIRGFAASGGRIWAVGDAGTILCSSDSGMRWEKRSLPLPAEAAAVLDFHAVEAVDQCIWIVGRPGSVVLRSGDSGESWSLCRTPNPTPLNAVDFVDQTHGWAVGDLGVILATEDGGRSWIVQQQGDGRAGILWVAADADGVPLSAVAKLGAEDGFRIVVEALVAAHPGDRRPGAASREARFAEAVRAAGGAAAHVSTRFPSPPPETAPTSESTLAHWHALHGRTEELLLREIALALRIWRPAIVVIDERPEDPHDPTPRSTVNRLCRDALRAAADPNMFREQLEVLGLAPSDAAALLVVEPPAAGGGLVLSPAQRGSRVPETFGVVGLLAESRMSEDVPSPREPFQLKPEAEGDGSIDSILGAVAEGSPGRRRVSLGEDAPAPDAPPPAAPDVSELLAGFGGGPDRQFEQMKNVLRAASPAHAGVLLFDLSGELATLGRTRDSKSVQDFLILHLPDHPLSTPVLRQMLQYFSSSEIARMERRGASEPERDLAPEARLAQALAYSGRMHAERRPLALHPMTAVATASAYRRLGKRELARRQFAPLLSAPRGTAARDIAELEMWEMNRSTSPLRRFARAVWTDEPPYLDGRLDDRCWIENRSISLDGASLETTAGFNTVVRIRYDDEYLYIAATCDFPDPSHRVEAVPRTSPDADSSDHDRLMLAFDVDRDYQTHFEFTIDCRGLVGDRCAGDPDWNPRWFVATDRDDKQWRVEAAVPLAELTDDAALTNQAWAFHAIRIVPGRAVLGWTGPTSPVVRGEDCTLLLFGGRDSGGKTSNRAN